MRSHDDCMGDWLGGGWLAAMVAGWLIGWGPDCLVGWLFGWRDGCLDGGLAWAVLVAGLHVLRLQF